MRAIQRQIIGLSPSKGVPTPPEGFVFLTDDDGRYVTDDAGQYILMEST